MFKWVSFAGAAIFLYVGVVLLFVPDMQMFTLGLTGEPEGMIMGRRSAPLFLAVGVMALFFARQPVSAARSVFAASWAGALLLVAGIGLWDLSRGAVRSDILVAIGVEVILGVALLLTMRKDEP